MAKGYRRTHYQRSLYTPEIMNKPNSKLKGNSMMPKFLRIIRSLHSWMGFIILPWIVLYGFTGFYLNHSKAINKLINASPYNESQFIVRPETEWLSLDAARERARQIWPNETILGTKAAEYHGFVTIQFSKPSGTVIVAIKTGHFYKKTRWYRHTYSPSGELRDRKVYWSYLFHYFHEAGWVNNRFGTLFADMTAIALILFGLSGLVLFAVPRQKKLVRLFKGCVNTRML